MGPPSGIYTIAPENTLQAVKAAQLSPITSPPAVVAGVEPSALMDKDATLWTPGCRRLY